MQKENSVSLNFRIKKLSQLPLFSLESWLNSMALVDDKHFLDV